jgi:hypothetical protein
VTFCPLQEKQNQLENSSSKTERRVVVSQQQLLPFLCFITDHDHSSKCWPPPPKCIPKGVGHTFLVISICICFPALFEIIVPVKLVYMPAAAFVWHVVKITIFIEQFRIFGH